MSEQYSFDDRKELINKDKYSDDGKILPMSGDNIYDK